jgi:undecaprenyl-diphosphatase
MGLAEIDISVFFFINQGMRNSFFDLVMPFITSEAPFVFLPLILLLFLKEKKKIWPVLIAGLLSIAFADAAGHIVKDLAMRQRPCSALDNVHLLVGCGKAYSFPSSHASNAFAFAMTMTLLLRNSLRPFFITVAMLIAFSRVYVGVHYPSDVLVGVILGTGAAYISSWVYRRVIISFRNKTYEKALFPMLLTLSFFRVSLIMTGPFDLTPDEAHYWEWSRRLDWSYYSKGPAIAWFIYIGTSIFGNTVLGVRIFAVIFSALSSVVLFRLGKDLYDERTGIASALLPQAVPLFSIFGMILTIDSPLVFFWILSLYLFHRAVREDKPPLSAWLLTGISVGAGLLTKYTMAFFPLSAFLYLFFRKDERRHLRTPGPYLAGIVSLVVFSPVIYWNAVHDWVTLRHTAGQANLQGGLAISVGSFGEFIGSQLGVITPLLFVMSLAGLRKVRATREGSFLLWFSMPIIVFFLLKSLQGKVQANWAMTGYITALVAFSAVYISGWEDLSRRLRISAVAAVFLALIVTVFAHFPSALHLPEKLDPSMRLAGWRELGREASNRYKELSLKGPAFVFSDKYQVTSELAFYMENNPVTYCANTGRRMNQYDLWPGFEGLKGQNALFIRAKDRGLPAEISSAFGSCERQVITATTKNKKKMKFTVATCYDFKGFESRPIEKY